MGAASLRASGPARRRGPRVGLAALLAAIAAAGGIGAASLLAALACAGFAGDALGQPAAQPRDTPPPAQAPGTTRPASKARSKPPAADATGERAGDGARIAAQGTPDSGAACAGCHGERGEGRAGAGFPRLAGQPAGYLASQLAAYADGRRPNPVMTPIAKALDDAQREAVAAHYAAIPVEGRGARTPPGAAATGRAATLARVGDGKLGVQACANCHGPDGSGVAPDMPGLAGQHEDYLLAALRTWRDGERRTDPSGQMPTIARRLREPDLQALAKYFSALPPGPTREAGGDSLAAAAAPVGTQAGARPAPGESATRAPAGGENRSARVDEPSGPRTSASDPPAGTPGAPAAGGPTGGTAPNPDALRGGSQGIGGGGAASGAGSSGSGSGEAR